MVLVEVYPSRGRRLVQPGSWIARTESSVHEGMPPGEHQLQLVKVFCFHKLVQVLQLFNYLNLFKSRVTIF